MTSVLKASELDERGLNDLKLLNDSIRTHQEQIASLLKRRKQMILRLRKQRITYRELAQTLEVSEQLIYKIIRDEIPREPQYDKDGNLVRKVGRPPKPSL
jgi:DNA-directed RNA polymerase specialized sigma subunit